MLQFDKLKIYTSLHNITVLPNNPFTKILNNDGEWIYSTFTSKIPSMIKIRLDYQHETAYIEFTGKILGDDYSKLISSETIKLAFQRIEKRCACRFEVDSIVQDAKVLSADITKDISISMDDEIKESLFMAISNTKRWKSEIRKNNGIDVSKSVKNNSKCRERLSLYCKSTELNISTNRPFIESLDNPEKMMSYFLNKTRVEYNLTSSHMIKKVLKIDSTHLQKVLTSNSNPLLEVFQRIFDISILLDEAYGLTGYKKFKTLNDFLKNLLLKEFDDDIGKVEQVYRHFHSPRSNYRVKRKELVRILNIRKGSHSESFLLKERVKQLVEKLV